MTTSMLKLELDRARQSLVERGVVMGRLFDSHEAERRQIANELHEESAQAMAGVLLGLRALERSPTADDVAALRRQVEETLAKLRRLAVSLRPPVLDQMGLVPAIERLASLEVHAERLQRERLPEQVETVAYRVAEEAIACLDPPVELRLAEVLDLLELTVTGTGVHCDGEAFWAIRARVELMGGTLSVDREGGALTCRLPLTPRPMLSAG